MDRLATMEAFARVAETKSFSEAARRLRSSKSLVSRQVADLETVKHMPRRVRGAGMAVEPASLVAAKVLEAKFRGDRQPGITLDVGRHDKL